MSFCSSIKILAAWEGRVAEKCGGRGKAKEERVLYYVFANVAPRVQSDPRNVRVHSLQSVSVSFSMHSVASWGLVDLRPAAKWSSFDLLILFNGNYDEKASGIFVTASIMNYMDVSHEIFSGVAQKT